MRGARILLAPADGAAGADIEHCLTRLGYAVPAVTHSAAEAVRLAGDLRLDLVLLDVRLPAAAEEMQARLQVPVIHFGPVPDESEAPTPPGAAVPRLVPPYAPAQVQAVLDLALSHHHAVQRLRAGERRWAAILNALGDAVVVTDTDGHVAFLNAAAEVLTGWPQDEAAGRPLLQLVSLLDEYTRRPLEDPAAGGAQAARPALLVTRDGRYVAVLLRAAPAAADGAEVVLTLRDVGDARRVEEQIRQAQKLDAVAQLAAGVSHDFNNLLTVVNGYSSLLLEALTPDHPWHGFLEEIQRAGERAAALTRRLLAFSRSQILQPRVLDLNALVTAAAEAVRHTLGGTAEVVTVLGQAVPSIRIDPRLVEQILLDLAGNARDAMPAGGRLTIETTCAVLTEVEARARAGFRPGPCARLRVSDTGQGMSEKARTRAFEPFFTTRPVGAGTGMGLASVHGTVRQSGGHIEVSSAAGQGTTFTIDFPAAADGAGPAAFTLPDLPRGTETLLLVEAEEGVRDLDRQILQTCGYTVLTAAGVPEALELSTRHPGAVHLFIVESVPGRIAEVEVWKLLRAEQPGLKLLVVSDYPEEDVLRDRWRGDGVALRKPYTPSELARKVREALEAPAGAG